MPHSDILAVSIPPEREKDSAYEDSKMIVEDHSGPMLGEENDEIQTEISALITPSLIVHRRNTPGGSCYHLFNAPVESFSMDRALKTSINDVSHFHFCLFKFL